MTDLQMGLLVLLGVVISLAASWMLTVRSGNTWQEATEKQKKELEKTRSDLLKCKSRIDVLEQELERMRSIVQASTKRPVVEVAPIARPVSPVVQPPVMPPKPQPLAIPVIVTAQEPEVRVTQDDFEVLQTIVPLVVEPSPSQEDLIPGAIMTGMNAIIAHRLAVTKPQILKSILEAAASDAERDFLRSLNFQVDFFGLDGTPSAGIVELVLLVVKETALVVPHYNSLANPFLGTWFELNRNQQPAGIIMCARARLDKDSNMISCVQKGRINL